MTVYAEPHPERNCERCGRLNCTWSVDSDRWNLAVNDNPGRESILCPACFVALHEHETGLTTCWTLTPSTPFLPIAGYRKDTA